MKNQTVSERFKEMATMLELKGENPFKVRAYNKAAQNIESISEDIEKVAAEDRLTSIPGVGKDLAEKIKSILETGTFKEYDELKAQIPEGLLKIVNIPGVGPKRAALIHKELGITSEEELKEAAQKGLLRNLPRMGAKTEANILRGIEIWQQARARKPLGITLPIAKEIINNIKSIGRVHAIDVAGSIRRKKETNKDIDILASAEDPENIMKGFTKMPMVKEVLLCGCTRSSIIIEQDLQVDLRIVPEESFGAALQYFTGSKNHNIHLRTIAEKMGLKVNEYGVFRGNNRIAGKTEEEVYNSIGLPFIPPELREDKGEIEAAQSNSLPELIEQKDIKGDLHMHTKWSDGANTIMEMAETAKKLGYSYIAITDHSQSLTVANGLTPERLLEQIKEIDKINEIIEGITILKGMEVDILSDGSLDMPDEVLQKLDVVIAAIHSGLKQPEEQLNARILSAIRHPLVNIIAHPTGRIIGERDRYPVDLRIIMQEAKLRGVAVELNSFPNRLDINDEGCRLAREIGVKVAINTDSHLKDQLINMEFGVATARRGWLRASDVINTMPLKELKKFLHKEGIQ